MNLFSGSLSSYLPSLLASRGVDVAAAGFVMAGGAAGLLFSLLLKKYTFNWWRAPPGIGLFLRGIACLTLAFLPGGIFGLIIAVFLWALSSLGSTMLQAGATSVRQLAAKPEHMGGRVGSLARTISWSTLPLSGVLSAVIVQTWDLRIIFLLAGCVSLLLVVAMRGIWGIPRSRVI